MKLAFNLTGCISCGLLGLILAGCSPKASSQPATPPPGSLSTSQTNQRVFFVKGTIKEIKPNGKSAVIQHEEVPDYMPAMTMPFDVKDTNELAGLRPGDAVSFRMIVTETDGWIDQIRKQGTNAVYTPPVVESVRQVRNVEPLNVGDKMADYPFVNEEGQPLKLSDFKGQALAFTFIFTRCPFPVFCPRMSENFSHAYKQLTSIENGPTNWHLISISFDPAHDTPQVLKAYAQRYNFDPKHWNFVTGQIIDIDGITEQFGLYFARDGASFNHNLRTVVVNAAGYVQKIFVGNEWKPEELVEEIVRAAAAH